MKTTIYFDTTMRTNKGKHIPYWDSYFSDNICEDQQEVWFHVGYGRLKLYRLHKVDDKNYIAEDLHKSKRTQDKE